MKIHNKSKPKNFNVDSVSLILLMVLLAVIIGLLTKPSETKIGSLEAEKITEMIFDDHIMSFATGGVIDEKKLQAIKGINYDEFKKSLNVKNDFCIYLEDENGNVILSKGPSKLSEDGLDCRE